MTIAVTSKECQRDSSPVLRTTVAAGVAAMVGWVFQVTSQPDHSLVISCAATVTGPGSPSAWSK